MKELYDMIDGELNFISDNFRWRREPDFSVLPIPISFRFINFYILKRIYNIIEKAIWDEQGPADFDLIKADLT